MGSKEDKPFQGNSLPTIGTNLLSNLPNSEPIRVRTIEDLPYDVIVSIFQEIVDEEALDVRDAFPDSLLGRPLTASVRLALVSKLWKQFVYETSSLWQVFSFLLDHPLDRVQTRFDRLLMFAKNAPVDLHLSRIHCNEGLYQFHLENCSCTDGRFFLSLQRISNLHRLSLEVELASQRLSLTPSMLPSLTNVRYLNFSIIWNARRLDGSHGIFFSHAATGRTQARM